MTKSCDKLAWINSGLLPVFLLVLFSCSQTAYADSHGTAVGPDNVSVYQCGNINQSGTYSMNQSLNGSTVVPGSNGCIEIQSDNVVLNCSGKYIRNNTVLVPGIYVDSFSNITVKNCNATMSANSYGMEFLSMDSSLIANNTASGNSYGMYLNIISNSVIANNTATNNSVQGIHIATCTNNSIINNTAINNTYGVYLDTCTNNNLTNNTARNNTQAGISLLNSPYSILMGNNASNNSIVGIKSYSSSNSSFINNTGRFDWEVIDIYSSENNTVSNNTASNSTYGIYLEKVLYSIVANNTLYNDSSAGIYVYGSSGNNMTNNTASLNNIGIIVVSEGATNAENNTVANNTANNNSVGISVQAGFYNTVANNTANNNSNTGIMVDTGGSRNYVINNIANNNSVAGIYVSSGTENNTILNNTLINNYYGIDVDSVANNNNFTDNTVNSSTSYGVYVYVSMNNAFVRNTIAKGATGVRLTTSANNNTFTSNNISLNTATGIQLYQNANNTFTSNEVDSNAYALEIESDSGGNNLTGNSIWNCTNTGPGCFMFTSAVNDFISYGSISQLAGGAFFFQAGSNNTFIQDVYLNGGLATIGKNLTTLVGNSINNTVLLSYLQGYDPPTQNYEYVEAGSRLIRQRELSVRVYNSAPGNDYIQNANITVYSTSGSVVWSYLASSATFVPTIAYINNGTSTVYYNYTANATKTGFLPASGSGNLTSSIFIQMFLTDIQAPAINMTFPSFGANLSGTNYNVNFTFNVSDDSPLANCSVFVNGTRYMNTTSMGSSGANSINATLPVGNYSAYVNCTDTSSYNNTGNSSTVNFSILKPAVNLTSPATGADFSGSSYNVTFVFNVTGVDGFANCSVYTNGATYANTSPILGTNNISAVLGAGSYSAYVNCTELLGSADSSQTINFTITAPPSSGGGGGGGSGGGGGGGGGGPITHKSTFIFMPGKGNSPVTRIVDDAVGVKDMKIVSARSGNNVKVVVLKLDGEPAMVVHISHGTVYQFMNITANETDAIGNLTFEVTKLWLAQNNYSSSNVVMRRFHSDAWEDLATRLVGETANAYQFEAITPGFSIFAIAAEPSAAESQNTPSGSAQQGGSSPSSGSSAQPVQENNQPQASQPVAQPGQQEIQNPQPQMPYYGIENQDNSTLIYLGVLGAVIVLGGAYVIRGKKKQDRKPGRNKNR